MCKSSNNGGIGIHDNTKAESKNYNMNEVLIANNWGEIISQKYK